MSRTPVHLPARTHAGGPPRRLALAAVLLAGGLALGGCTETRFAAPLGDNIETCDTRWKGLWLDADDSATPQGASGLFVDAGCQVEVLDQPEPGGPIKRLHVPVNFVHDRGNDYLVVSDAQLKGLVELSAPHAVSPPPEKSFFFVRYRVAGDVLELYDVDSARVAKLVVDDTLRGTVNKTASELHVWVDGDRAQMLDVVRKYPIFSVKPTTTLKRSRLGLADYERNVTKPPPKPPRRQPPAKH